MDSVGLADRLHHRPGALSGGECQRVAMVRALVTQPLVVLADEPSGNLDEATSESLHDLLAGLARERGQAFVVMTHDRKLAQSMDRRGRIEAGCAADGRRCDMKCGVCAKREAVVAYTHIVDDVKQTLLLCHQCASEKNIKVQIAPAIQAKDAPVLVKEIKIELAKLAGGRRRRGSALSDLRDELRGIQEDWSPRPARTVTMSSPHS